MIMRRYLLIALLLTVTLGLMATAYTPSTVPNPRATDGKAFVANPDNILSDE